MEQLPLDKISTDWVSLAFLICMLLLSYLKIKHKKRFNEFITLLFSFKFFAFQGKKHKIETTFNIVLFGVQAISVSLFIYLYLQAVFTENYEEGKDLFFQIFAFFTGFVLIKYFIERIISHIFNIENLIDTYLFYKLSYRNLLSLIILFFCALCFYSFPRSAILLKSFAVVFISLNTFIVLMIYLKHKKIIARHLFYFILYLCALEISPYYLLYKIVES